MQKLMNICLCMMTSLLMVGCHQERSAVHILCPTGAPSLALVGEYENITKDGNIQLVDGTDQLIAELTKADSEYDIIIAPINLGTQFMTKRNKNDRLKIVFKEGKI